MKQAKDAPDDTRDLLERAGNRELLLRARDRAIVDLAEANWLIRDTEARLKRIDAAIRGEGLDSELRTRPDTQYSGMKCIDAIESFLNGAGPTEREAIVKALLAGGMYINGRSARVGPPVQVSKSITRNLQRLSKKKGPRLREVRGLIGLASWPDEKFKP